MLLASTLNLGGCVWDRTMGVAPYKASRSEFLGTSS